MRSVLFSYLGEKKHTLLLWMGIELIFVILLSLYRVLPRVAVCAAVQGFFGPAAFAWLFISLSWCS